MVEVAHMLSFSAAWKEGLLQVTPLSLDKINPPLSLLAEENNLLIYASCNKGPTFSLWLALGLVFYFNFKKKKAPIAY